MPKLKSVIAGLAFTTAMTGGVIAGGTASATPVSNAPVVMNDDFGDDFDNGFGFNRHHFHHQGRHHKCGRHHHGGWGGGGGWGRRSHRNDHVCIVVRNHNFNDNQDLRRHRRDHRHDHHNHLDPALLGR
ncbi:hypothetical protein ACIBP6_42480 [Nonomuraea terrae]|uniref:hypothetical protein n=1 Tax=Nonomuraea terrae TaxID=2530383 RepID=UPI0037A0FB9E